MKKILHIILLAVMLTGCEVFKDKVETHNREQTTENRQTYETEYKVVKRPKDTVVFIPNVKYEYKDTTIVRKGKTTTLRINYDTQGKVDQADCTSEAVIEFIKTQREINEKIIAELDEHTTQKTKESKPVSLWILYVFVGLAVLLMINHIIPKLWRDKSR